MLSNELSIELGKTLMICFHFFIKHLTAFWHLHHHFWQKNFCSRVKYWKIDFFKFHGIKRAGNDDKLQVTEKRIFLVLRCYLSSNDNPYIYYCEQQSYFINYILCSLIIILVAFKVLLFSYFFLILRHQDTVVLLPRS
jgi:hypothetical protein